MRVHCTCDPGTAAPLRHRSVRCGAAAGADALLAKAATRRLILAAVRPLAGNSLPFTPGGALLVGVTALKPLPPERPARRGHRPLPVA